MAERNFITGLTSQRQSIPHFKVFTKYVNYEFETVTHMPDCHQKLVAYILHFHFNIMSSFSALGKYREAFNKWTSEKKVLLKIRIFRNVFYRNVAQYVLNENQSSRRVLKTSENSQKKYSLWVHFDQTSLKKNSTLTFYNLYLISYFPLESCFWKA